MKKVKNVCDLEILQEIIRKSRTEATRRDEILEDHIMLETLEEKYAKNNQEN